MTSQIAWRKPVILEGQSIVLGKIKAEARAQDKGLEDAKNLYAKIFPTSQFHFHQKTDWINSVRKQDL